MTDADRFRALAAQCMALQGEAKRGDVRTALHCLAREYAIKARAAAVSDPARLPVAWPMIAMQRQMAALMRVGFAFWLPR
jgi:hypothetical protein